MAPGAPAGIGRFVTDCKITTNPPFHLRAIAIMIGSDETKITTTEETVMKKMLIAATCCVALVGCETVQDNQNTAIGAGVGAGTGAALGALIASNSRQGALIGAGIGRLAGAAVGHYLDQQQRALEQSLAGTGAEVDRRGDQLYVTMPASITFATDSDKVQQQFFPVLRRVANNLNEYPQSYIDVIGHTDSTGDPNYNQELSQRRADSVSRLLVTRGNVERARIASYGQGEATPIATNDTAAGRQANRRVEIVVTPATEG